MDRTTARPEQLKLDLRNPRQPGESFANDDEALVYLIENADVSELITSIANSGWLDFEPLIVLKDDYTVVEGNRRLAALRFLADEELRRRYRVSIPANLHTNALPSEVQIFTVDTRADARDFIGFKHINGPYKWDALAKAKYAWEWLQEDPSLSIKQVSERLGDGHSTVRRLVNGFKVLRQAQDLGFDIEDTTRFSFSHLYTALPSPSVRAYLGLVENPNDLLPADPVPKERHEALLRYLTWLYGQGDDPRVVRSQNPDLGVLTKILGNTNAARMLESGESFASATEMVEDRQKGFQEAIFRLSSASTEAISKVSGFDGDPDLLALAQDVQSTTRRLVAAMRDTDDSAGAN